MKIDDKVRISIDKVNIPLDYQGCEGIIVKIVSGKLSSCEKREYWIRIKDVFWSCYLAFVSCSAWFPVLSVRGYI